MGDSRFVIERLRHEYEVTLAMLRDAIDNCPDRVWRDETEKPAYWHEVYHTLFWCDNLVGDAQKPFERCPVGVDIPPPLFLNPGAIRSKDELLGLLVQAEDHIAARLGKMKDANLNREDGFAQDVEDVRCFDNVLHRLFYGLRHGQHHVGKLCSRLAMHGANQAEWRG